LFSWLILGWLQFEWVQVYNPCRVKTIRIAAFSIMDNPTLLLLLLVSVTHLFYLPLVMTSCLGQLWCEEWEFSHRLGGFGRCVLDQESGMLEWPEFGVWMMIYLDVAYA
jgi:hypothetical protein